MELKLKFLIGMAGINVREFSKGWYEGMGRAKFVAGGDIIPASGFARKSVAFAASQAAVAFSLGMEGR